MKNLALTLPDGTIINTPTNTAATTGNLGSLISGLLNIAVYISGALLLIWLVWGIFQYIFAGGNKEALAKARSRITWALIGFIIVILAFAISQYAQGLLPGQTIHVTPITEPT